MKLLTTFCRGMDFLRKYLPELEIRCLKNADIEFIKSAEIALVFHWKEFEKQLPQMKNLRMIQSLTAGVDHFNFSVIPDDVVVCSNSGANADGVAEHAVALVMAAAKKIVWRDRQMRDGKFPQMEESILIKGKNMLVVGLGHVGQRCASIFRCMGANVFGVNRTGKCALEGIVVEKIDHLEDLLPKMDIVILALPLTKDTRNLFDKNKFSIMKDSAIFVNVARGKIVVEKDLYEHLVNNPRFIAALDVWWKYDEEFHQNYPFEKLQNVILSPHCAGSYEGWFESLLRSAVENIKAYLSGNPKNIVDKKEYL